MTFPRHNPWTLRFESDDLEASFRDQYARASVLQVRYAVLLGVLFYGLVFGVVDLVSQPGHVTVVWVIRGVVSVLGLGVVALTYTDAFQRVMQPVVAGLMTVAGLGLVVMLALDPSGTNYYDGPLLILLTTFLVVRLRFVAASLVGWTVVAAYGVVAAGVKVTAFVDPIPNVIMMASTTVIGMFGGYMLERYARRQYWQSTVINEKRKENARLLETRSRFFANVSHEIRTPLTLIMGPLDDLRNDDPVQVAEDDPDRLRRILGGVHQNAERLLRLFDQLLDLARLEVGKWPLRTQETDLVGFVETVARAFRPYADRKDVTLTVDAEPDRLPLYADPDKLEKVVANLLSNALKFTPEGGTVRVQVDVAPTSDDERNSARDALLRIRDSGPGIPEEDLPHLFDRFHQSDASTLRRHGGTGIGLALTKELVTLHGGDVEVESEVGFGTTFTVTLPTGTAHLKDEQVRPPSDKASDDAEAVADAPGSTPAPEVLPLDAADGEPAVDTSEDDPDRGETAEDAPDETVTVLVIDDDPGIRQYVRDGLKDRYDVQTAPDGKSGLSKAEALVPDLIVLDVMMPEVDGYAVCDAVKSHDALDHIPVVMLTAKAEPDDRVSGLDVGADAYLTKPFRMRELRAQIDNLLTNRRRLHARYRETPDVEASEVDVDSAQQRFLQSAREAVEANLDDPDFDVDAFATEMGLSRRQLQRKLKSITGRTPNAFIRRIRLGRAAQLVVQDYGTVSEIAYAVGFNTPSYFTKCFREAYGVPPTEYDASDAGPDDAA